MEFSPRRSPSYRKTHRKLYRKRLCAVTLAALILLASSWLTAQEPRPQYGRKPPAVKGPRAIGLIQLSPKGKGRLTPIAIMMDGKFFDAGSYKAAPVPMALDFGVVYEGFRAGVSQGVFTITQPGQLNHVWIAEGTWIPAGSKALEKHKKYTTPVIADDDRDGPPVLHRRSEKPDSDSSGKSDKDKKEESKPATPSTPPTAGTTTAGTTTTGTTPTAGTTTATAPTSAPAPSSAPEVAKTSAPTEPDRAHATDETIRDPNRPVLRRGKPDPSAHRDEPYATFEPLANATATGAAKPGATGKSPAAAAPPAVAPIVIPAISDAGGPDPRSYTYDLKPAEEAIYRNKMLDLAASELRAELGSADKAAVPKKTSANKSLGKSGGKPPTPAFDDVSLRIFDLSSSNEPVLVLSAKTRPPAGAPENFEPKEITLIARTSLEGELKKLFFSQTDSRHLDITPRMELIDAVDADGDGRGELLFRRTFDGGSAYAIYRVTYDRLWPLFEGTP
jgi:hypothetical protein